MRFGVIIKIYCICELERLIKLVKTNFIFVFQVPSWNKSCYDTKIYVRNNFYQLLLRLKNSDDYLSTVVVFFIKVGKLGKAILIRYIPLLFYWFRFGCVFEMI